MQFTRFLRNNSVTAKEMAAFAAEGTAARVSGRDIVVVQDTSELALGGRRAKAQGYGPIGKGGAVRGLLLHASLAVDASNGGVVGLVDAKVWNRSGSRAKHRRSRTTAQKETQRWIDTTARAAEVLKGAASITCVSDRESDVYEHFALRPETVHLVVRACQNRRIETDEAEQIELLFTHMDALPEQGRFKVDIPTAPGRKARTSELVVRFAPVVLRRPRQCAATLPQTVALTMVDVRELSAPAGAKPIHWRLLTTRPVTSLGDARRTIGYYRMRWVSEEYFHTIKTGGFDVEAADIGQPEVMIRFVAAIAVAGVTVMQLVKARDGTTHQSVVEVFDPADVPILEAISESLPGRTARQRNPYPKGSLAFAAWVIAHLGGWDGYYGKPGPKTMRLGLEAFERIKFGTALRLQNV
ncbi:MAG TPA: IS4 family transposase [Edaphobacter sp.]